MRGKSEEDWDACRGCVVAYIPEEIGLLPEESLQHNAELALGGIRAGAARRQAVQALWTKRGGARRRGRVRPYDTLHDVAWCLVNTKEFLFRI